MRGRVLERPHRTTGPPYQDGTRPGQSIPRTARVKLFHVLADLSEPHATLGSSAGLGIEQCRGHAMRRLRSHRFVSVSG